MQQRHTLELYFTNNTVHTNVKSSGYLKQIFGKLFIFYNIHSTCEINFQPSWYEIKITYSILHKNQQNHIFILNLYKHFFR